MRAHAPHPMGPTRDAPAPPALMVVFGAAGDMTKRLLIPALYNLVGAKLLDEGFAILGVDRTPHDDAGFRTWLREMMDQLVKDHASEFGAESIDEEQWRWLEQRLFYVQGDFQDPGTIDRVAQRMKELEPAKKTGNTVFYLATLPRFFGPLVDQLGKAGLLRETRRGWRRVIIEKPFGTDLASAQALDRRILQQLDERQIFRIDHYLGKETVQNLMVLRFGNGIFEPLWNRQHIDHVQITAAEVVGVETRGSFYDTTGALRDMVPNHMLQLLAMTAMEAPNSFDPDAVRTEKTKVLQAIHRMSEEDAAHNAIRGQYRAGQVRDRAMRDYRAEPNVAPDSRTETFVALKLMVDNWRWAGVPFYIRTGKALRTRRTEIAIEFKRAPHTLFRNTPAERLVSNAMVVHIQPEEGISLRFGAKVPGPNVEVKGVNMDFRYVDYFQAAPSTGYETLIYDCLTGDAMLFQRADSVEAGWAAVQPVLDAWAAGRGEVYDYTAGSAGPLEAEALLARDGRRWRSLG